MVMDMQIKLLNTALVQWPKDGVNMPVYVSHNSCVSFVLSCNGAPPPRGMPHVFLYHSNASIRCELATVIEPSYDESTGKGMLRILQDTLSVVGNKAFKMVGNSMRPYPCFLSVEIRHDGLVVASGGVHLVKTAKKAQTQRLASTLTTICAYDSDHCDTGKDDEMPKKKRIRLEAPPSQEESTATTDDAISEDAPDVPSGVIDRVEAATKRLQEACAKIEAERRQLQGGRLVAELPAITERDTLLGDLARLEDLTRSVEEYGLNLRYKIKEAKRRLDVSSGDQHRAVDAEYQRLVVEWKQYNERVVAVRTERDAAAMRYETSKRTLEGRRKHIDDRLAELDNQFLSRQATIGTLAKRLKDLEAIDATKTSLDEQERAIRERRIKLGEERRALVETIVKETQN
jgi:hypothetical protein